MAFDQNAEDNTGQDDGDDLRATIAAAFTDAADDASGATPAAKPQTQADTGAEDGRDRDGLGRFAAKPEDASAGKTEVEGQAQPTDTEADRPPHGLAPAIKAKWEALDPDVRAEFARRERETSGVLASSQRKAEVYNRFDELFAPHKDKWAMQGVEPVQAVHQLLAAQNFLERDPVNGLVYLAKSYGVDLRQFAQGVQQQAQGQQFQLPPQLQGLAQDVETLKSTLAQQQQQASQTHQATIAKQIETFSSDPANRYFADVQDDMAALITSGQAKDLADAYDRATWARPDIRKLILADQSAKEQAGKAEAARAKAGQARKASGSVTGSPSPGSGPAAADNSNTSLRTDLEAAIQALSA